MLIAAIFLFRFETVPTEEEAAEQAAAVAEVDPEAAQVAAGSPLGRAETALAREDLVGLMHVNAERIVELEREILGPEDPEALIREAADRNALMRALIKAGVDPREQLKHLVGGLYLPQETSEAVADDADGEAADPSVAAVLIGDFPVEQIFAAIANNYDARREVHDGRELVVIATVDEETCKEHAPVAVDLGPERIVVGRPEIVPSILERLESGAGPSVDLNAWRAYRSHNLLSFSLLVPPQDIAGQVDQPAARAATKGAEERLADVTGFRAGLRLETDPVAFLLNARIGAANEAWPAAAAADFRAWREDVRAQYQDKIPSLAALQEHIELQAEGSNLEASASLDRAVVEKLGRLPAELLTLAFRGLGGSDQQMSTPQPTQERTLDPGQVQTFRETANIEALPSYGADSGDANEIQTISGPFGLRLAAAKINADGQVTLEIEVDSSEIFNLSHDSLHADDEAVGAALVIARVLDADGRDLLAQEDCGRDRNSAPARLGPTTKSEFVDDEFKTYPAVSGGKTVRLVPGARLDQVATIDGYVRLEIPTRVETVKLEAPFDGQVVEVGGARLAFAESDSGLKYDISGQMANVLAVRALNAEGDHLASTGSFASGRFMGKGKAVERGFAGEPAAAEIVVATETATRIFDFKLKDPSVAFDTWDIPKPYTVKAIGEADLQRAVKRWQPREVCRDKSEPQSFDVAALCLTSIWASWQGTVQTQIAAALPMHQGLRGNLSALEIRGSSVSLGDEKIEILENKGGYLLLLDTDNERQVDNGLGDYVTFETAVDDLQGTPTALSGSLVLRLSRHIEPISLPLDVLGREVKEHGMRVTYVGLEDGAVELRLDGPRERLVQFVPFDAAGTQRATNAVHVEWDDEAKLWQASFRVDGRPDRVDIVVAVDQQVVEYDFELKAPKSE